MLELKFTKLLDVKSPVGIEQRGEVLENYSIGCDLHMPEFDEAFIEAFIKANAGIVKSEVRWYEKENTFYAESIPLMTVLKKGSKLIDGTICERTRYFVRNKRIQIPSGIAICMEPHFMYCTINSKSSNFKNNYTVIEGTIDMNYTYGMGIQLLRLDDDYIVTLEADQKIAQLIPVTITHQIHKMTELSGEDFDLQPAVIQKRQKRTGGFGSTGKF